MTVSTTQNRITYNGNGITTVYSFPYKFIETTDLQVYVNGDLLVEDVDYTVGVPSDSGADITFNVAPSSALSNVVILRDPNLLQDTDLPTNGRLPADAIERMVDKVTLVAQRLRDLLDRTIRRNDADPANTTLVLPVAVANKALIFNASGELDVGVDDYIDQAADAAASALIASNAAISAEASLDAIDDRYLGSKNSDPALDNDGQALLTGALYWNSTTNKLRIYNGAAWQDTATATPASFTSNLYNGTGSQTAFTLSTTPASVGSVFVFISGVAQRPTTDYTISGTTLNFVSAPPLGTNNVLAFVASTVAAGTPDNDSVSEAKIQNSAVTTGKIADGNVTFSKLDANIFADAATTTPETEDYLVLSETDDAGGATKRALVSDVLGLASSLPVGAIVAYAGSSTPSGFLACPTSATNVSRTTYAALFAAIGTTWGAGDGSTTFGIPFFSPDYAPVQANGNLGTTTVGQVIAHAHTSPTSDGTGLPNGSGGNLAVSTDGSTGSSGGSANLAAGSRVRFLVKF